MRGTMTMAAWLASSVMVATVLQAPARADEAETAEMRTLVVDGARGTVRYYASDATAPTSALIALHGHSRDANTTFDAGMHATSSDPSSSKVLVIAPIFQVAESRASHCHTDGVPEPGADDLLWTCSSWGDGEPSLNGAHASSFAVLDALIVDLHRRWPSVRTVTLAGFSAGAQIVQRYVGFAADPPAGVTLRYVIADPGSWLYFDAVRPFALDTSQACPARNRWKYGTDQLPAWLSRDASAARARYAAADLTYLEGERDGDDARGTAYSVLDRSCAAMLQGPYRLQRGLAYSEYDRSVLSRSAARTVKVVPGCAHSVACVFGSSIGRAALNGTPDAAR